MKKLELIDILAQTTSSEESSSDVWGWLASGGVLIGLLAILILLMSFMEDTHSSKARFGSGAWHKFEMDGYECQRCGIDRSHPDVRAGYRCGTTSHQSEQNIKAGDTND